MIKIGILEQTRLVDVLQRIEANLKNGLLVAETDGEEIELYFQEGRLQCINHKNYLSLGERLVQAEVITEDDLRAVYLTQQTIVNQNRIPENQNELAIVHALIQLKLLSREMLNIWLTQEAIKLLQDFLKESEYGVYLDEGIKTPPHRFPLNFRVTSLIDALYSKGSTAFTKPKSSATREQLLSTPVTPLFKVSQPAITTLADPVTPSPDVSAYSQPLSSGIRRLSLPTKPFTSSRSKVEDAGTRPVKAVTNDLQIAPGEAPFIAHQTVLEKFVTIPMKIINSVLYKNTSTIAGPLEEGNEIHYTNVFSQTENWTLWLFTLLNIITTLGLIGWMLWPTRFNYSDFASNTASILIACLMSITELIRFVQSVALIFFAQRAKDPIALKPKPGLRVAVLTTIVPGKEPLDLIIKTLQAMKRIRYDGIVDVWLLDEGNSPEVRATCEAIGVNHFSRKGIPEFNQPSGPFRAKTKHGNHNSWRAKNEQSYDIVAQMDPDHVPTEDFLLRTVGYFNDPDVGFVVAPQVYGNLADNWIAKGSAILAYVFHGIIQRGGNGNNAPLLIGTNHLYKTACFHQINGYQDCIIEDHLTSMVVFATRNPMTGNYWKGVYTPDILAVGEGPTSFTDFFSQQMRWAYGIWEIVTTFSPKLFPFMKKSQQFSFILLQMFYPSVAATWVLSNLVTIASLLLGFHADQVVGIWMVLWVSSLLSSLGFFFWLRRFNLVTHERKDSGLIGMALMLMCIPIYTEAAFRRLSGKPLSYVVTAKGKLTSGDSLRTFYPHLKWGVILAGVLIFNLFGVGSSYPSLRIWLCFNLAICMSPIIVYYITRFSHHFAQKKSKMSFVEIVDQASAKSFQQVGSAS